MAQSIKANIIIANDDIELESNNICLIFLRPVSETEITPINDNLKDDSAPGFVNITTKTLRIIAPMIVKPLCYLINLMFAHGKCPKQFKIAIVKPMYKKEDRNRVENYRPMSLISTLSNIFERAFKAGLINFLDKYSLLSKMRFGFQTNRFTNDAIALLT
ncbi:hypothetical protein JTB14_002003 [Gonioctena quinquepunctata]|nr:hypothetical protein JTB14_002003 [Gonioctena quinquepunctata]